MKKLFTTLALLLSAAFLAWAAPRSLSMQPMMEKGTESPLQRPQIAQDLDGLDPKEGGISKGLRGSFLVKHYITGPWKGGTAVIELASDSSYAEIRIYDKDGTLQRIYSIQPKSDKTRINPASIKNPLKMVEEVNASDAAQNAAQSSAGATTSIARSPQREAAVQEQTERAEEAEATERSSNQTSVPGLRAGTMSNARGEIRETSTGPDVTENESAAAPAEAKRVVRVRHRRRRKHPQNSLDTPLSGGSTPDQYEYYYEDVVVTSKKSGTPETSPTDSGSTSKPPMQVAQLPPAAAPPVIHPPATNSGASRSTKSSSTGMTDPLLEAVALTHPTPSAGSTQGTAAYDESSLPDVTQAVKETESERPGHAHPPKPSQIAPAPEEPQTPPAPAVASTALPSKPVLATGHAHPPQPTQITPAPEETEAPLTPAVTPVAPLAKPVLETGHSHPPQPTQIAPASDEAETPPTPAPSASAPKTPSAPVTTEETKTKPMPLPSDSWKPKPTQVASLPEASLPGVATPTPVKASKAVVDDTIPLAEAMKRAHELDSDKWAPKATNVQPSDAELGLTPLPSSPAKTPRSATGVASDDLVPMSSKARKGSQVGAGDNWSPTKGPAKLSAQEEARLAMLNNLKPTPKPAVVKINQDVNNPDEGVLPFYSLEKYSGAQYGRHREFERRVVYKQNKKSSVQGYDFYIDEVDRKQEKHYLYFYKIDPKTKKAKLIATEKHEQVSFLSDYDIGSEDKGKIARE